MNRPVGRARAGLWVVVGTAAIVLVVTATHLTEVPPSATTSRPQPASVVSQVKARALAVAGAAVGLQLDQALRERAAAVRGHDRARFLAAVAPGARRDQATVYRRLAVVPFDRYRLVARGAPDLTRAELAAGRAVQPVLVVSRLAGDEVSSRRPARARFRLAAGRWRLVDVTPRRPEVWDLDQVVVAHGEHSLVLAVAAAEEAAALAAAADAAVEAVDATWPLRWPGQVVVVLPRDPGQLVRLVGEPGSARLAGVTSFEGYRAGSVVRVRLNPALFPGLVPLGRQILLRHEITHAAQYGRSTDRVPAWLAEGTAEYVGYLGSGVPDDVVASSVLGEAASGRLPVRLPADADFAFTGGGAHRRAAYEEAWTACRTVVDRYGQQALFALYRASADGRGGTGHRQRAAVRAVLHVPYITFVQQWQDWLRSHA